MNKAEYVGCATWCIPRGVSSFVFIDGCLSVPLQDMDLRHATFFFAPTRWANGTGVEGEKER